MMRKRSSLIGLDQQPWVLFLGRKSIQPQQKRKRYKISTKQLPVLNSKNSSYTVTPKQGIMRSDHCLPSMFRQFNLSSFAEKLELEQQRRKLQKIGTSLSKKLRLFSLISEKWYQMAMNSDKLRVYFFQKNREAFLVKFTDYLGLMFRQENDVSFQQLRKIHAPFKISGLQYEASKIILFKIITNITLFTPRDRIECAQRMERFRQCFYFMNELLTVIPLDKLVTEVGCNQLDSRFLTQLVYFIVHCFGLENILEYVRANKIKVRLSTLIYLKTNLLRICFRLKMPRFIIRRVAFNFRYFQQTMIYGTNLTQKIIQKYHVIDRIIDVLRAAQLPYLQKNSAQNSAITCLFHFLLDINSFAYSNQEIAQLIRPSVDFKGYCKATEALLQFLAKDGIPACFTNNLPVVIKDIARLLFKTYDEKAVEQLCTEFEAAKQLYRRFGSEQVPMRCMSALVAQLSQDALLTSRQLKLIHREARVGSAQAQFLCYCIEQASESQSGQLKQFYKRFEKQVLE